MKKGTAKYVVGGIIAGVGVLMATIALCIGGFNLITNFPEVTLSPFGVHVIYNNGDETDEDLVSKGEKIVDIKNIKNVDIDIEYGKVTILTADVEDIDIQAKNVIEERFKYGVEGETLKIRYKRGISIFNIGFGRTKTEITITLPSSIAYEYFDIDNGAGEMKISDISANKITVDNGAGEVTLKNFEVKDKLDISTGAGELKLDEVNCGMLKLDSGVGAVHATETKCGGLKFEGGVGEMSFEGEIDGNVNVNTGVGEVRMTVYGKSSDYNFKVDSGIGQVRVNGNTPIQNTGGKYDFKVDTGVGEVRIDFKDKGSV